MWGPQHGLPISLARSPKHNGGQWIYTYMYHKIKPNVGKYTTIHHTWIVYDCMILYGYVYVKNLKWKTHCLFLGGSMVQVLGCSDSLCFCCLILGGSSLEAPRVPWDGGVQEWQLFGIMTRKWKIDRVGRVLFFSLRIGRTLQWKGLNLYDAGVYRSSKWRHFWGSNDP